MNLNEPWEEISAALKIVDRELVGLSGTLPSQPDTETTERTLCEAHGAYQVKIKDDPIYGSIRSQIINEWTAAGSPLPKENWLYSRLVEARHALAALPTKEGPAQTEQEKELRQSLEATRRALSNRNSYIIDLHKELRRSWEQGRDAAAKAVCSYCSGYAENIVHINKNRISGHGGSLWHTSRIVGNDSVACEARKIWALTYPGVSSDPIKENSTDILRS